MTTINTNSHPVQPRAIRPIDITWWSWALVTVLIAAGLAGIPLAREAALSIAALQATVHLARSRSLRHFPTQVRAVYLTWMAVSFLGNLGFLAWIQMAGTAVLVLTGYCPLARVLLLLPINRSVPLSLRTVRRIIFTPPTSDSVRDDIDLCR